MTDLRMKFELSQADAARVLGVTNALLISQWETGYRRPTLIVRRFIKLLNDLPKEESSRLLKRLESYNKVKALLK